MAVQSSSYAVCPGLVLSGISARQQPYTGGSCTCRCFHKLAYRWRCLSAIIKCPFLMRLQMQLASAGYILNGCPGLLQESQHIFLLSPRPPVMATSHHATPAPACPTSSCRSSSHNGGRTSSEAAPAAQPQVTPTPAICGLTAQNRSTIGKPMPPSCHLTLAPPEHSLLVANQLLGIIWNICKS